MAKVSTFLASRTCQNYFISVCFKPMSTQGLGCFTSEMDLIISAISKMGSNMLLEYTSGQMGDRMKGTGGMAKNMESAGFTSLSRVRQGLDFGNTTNGTSSFMG